MMMPIHTAQFVKSAYKPNQSPEVRLPEIVVIGRSNVGKSSFINALTGRKELAKVGKTPGKTTLINFFSINQDAWYLVDFPGYGYAKKSKAQRAAWLNMMQDYLTNKPDIAGILLLINSHIPLQETDKLFMELLTEAGLSFSIVFTKIDKSSQSDLHHHRVALYTYLEELTDRRVTVFPVSSVKGRGFHKVQAHIDDILSHWEIVDAGVA